MIVKRLLLPVAFTLSVLTPNILIAQVKVGTALVSGKKVELYSNSTWAYADEGAEGKVECVSIAVALDFCGMGLGWERLNDNSPEVTALFRYDDRNYGMFIVEEIGSDNGVSAEIMRLAVIGNFADGADISPEEVTVLSVETVSFDEKPSETITYAGNIGGLEVVFRNTVIVENQRTIQVATYSIDSELTESHKKLHDAFSEATKLK